MSKRRHSTGVLFPSIADTTHLEGVARESAFKWNKDYAKKTLAKVINQG